MKSKTLFCAAWLAATLALAPFDTASAAPVRWRSSTVHVAVEGKDLKDVLRDFTASQGVAASIANNVAGTVTGRFDMSPQRFLDTLASTFGFVWFYDGSVLSISNANDVTHQVIKLDHAAPGDLRGALQSLGIEDRRFPVVYDEAGDTAIVNGPPQYVQMVAEVARRLDDSAGRRTGSVIRVFKLKNAWAADHKVQIDGNTITVPGVATVLSNMYHAKQKEGGGANGSQNAMSPNMQRVPQMADVGGGTSGGGSLNPPLPQNMPQGADASLGGLISGTPAPGQGAAGNVGYANAPGSSGQGTSPSGGDLTLPVIQPDPTTNTVLIRDLPQRIDQYASLIGQLDTRPKLIEIEAHIVEIDDNLLQQIGIDWRAHNSHLDFQTGTGTYQQNGYDGNINPNFGTTTLADGTTVVQATPVGASLTAVLGDAGRYLLARINASAEDSKAKIDATPKVATLDNVEAVMDNKTRFFVRVSGYTSADLYSISTGVSLRVLPMVVDENGQVRIKMNVHIEDGQLTGQQVDSIPVITSSEINTQAVVGQGESLLIAGYSTDNLSNGVTSVPGLSKIPIIGALFRNNSDTHSHMERVFLLTPRVLDL
ncbi:MAG: type III secretion system outer membrane ring subunit SctC [Paraburkholderia tropica]|uniref:Type 3 secretion system secretin n=1 Tax=Paraburkholderia tropica TaxID=92647 RepID=A0AAQ1GD46_9BURK|nr:type III secretion system outer membrane ring subunit SctC [Paraburkholderia tropica]MDE1144636.1 type III secretion system outer membrane ring subunit SctC [Paraburkholderia tropica]PXX17526.1 type III secretion protein C [Paraburkholderia tropica]PZW84708.1 type III secretion protein C [Paraburkholderia tropica]QNB15001.1 EscC/YscC/HrcC family type III secretion system outer membrane ring protein [Paraburkholderia tropica]RQN39822.1 EscC/YscC/HrcC family type III secretion system outer me